MEGTPFGRYRLVEVLGRGGMGEVWRAFDTVTERTVAVKVLPAHLAGDEGFQKRFLREAKAAASLNEPHVVPIYDFGEIDGRLFVAMRLVDGRDLQALLTDGPLSPERAVTIIEQVASALQAAHGIGLVHRDVKPSNILVGDDDFAYLIDFGIARVAGETGLTSTGMTLGTWPYMAPERFRTGTADARADVYALTCVLHQALTGQQPFPGESLEQIATGHMFDPPPRPSAIQSSVPAAMDNIIAMGMVKDPDERYATTKDLARAARAALPGHVSSATIAAARAETLAAPAPGLNDAPTQYAPTSGPRESDLDGGAEAYSVPSPAPQALDRRSKLVIGSVVLVALSAVLGLMIAATNSSRDQSSSNSSTSPSLPTTTPLRGTAIGPSRTQQRQQFVDPYEQLRTVVPTDVNCQMEKPNGVGATAVAAASCQPGGPINRLSYVLFTDTAGMNARIDTFPAKYVTQPCPGMAGAPARWRSSTGDIQREGRVTCGVVSWRQPPIPFVAFTIDTELVSGWIQGAPGESVGPAFQWWQAHYA